MSRTLQPEDRIAHYKIIGPLGAGGMGEVYLAHDETLERDVALKVLSAELVRSEDRVKRFVMEAKSASSLSHPHIVTIYEIGHDRVHPADGSGPSHEEIQYIAMELIRGKTLKDLVHHEKLDLRTLLGHLAQAAEGLSKAHAAGIVHRDLKPGNIMVTADGYAKVLDFGLAKLTERGSTESDLSSAPTEAGDRTGAGVILGTIGYMSPEQVKGKGVDHRSDVFSFGCILYETATRKQPFAAESGLDTMHRIVHDQPAAVDGINPDVPAELRRLIRRCLAKNPDQRLQSIKDLAIELREIVDEFDTLSPSATSGSTLTGPALAPRRGIAMTVGIAALAVLGIAGIAFGIWSLTRVTDAGGPPAGRPFQTVQMKSLMSDRDVLGAVLSPDGRYLAYIKGPLGEWSLWVRQVATGSDVEIMRPQAVPIRGISFSPDGNYLYYLGRDTETPDYSALFEVPSLGGQPRKRIFDIDTAISFSPDGRRVAFVRGAPHENRDLLMIADLGTGEDTVLASADYPARFPHVRPDWSPDGSRIAAIMITAEEGFRQRISSFDVQTGAEELVTRPQVSSFGDAAWLPDASGLVGTRSPRPGLSRQIFFFPYPRGEPHQITNDLDTYAGVSVTEDGASIAGLRTSREVSLWVAPLGGGPARQVTSRSSTEGIGNLLPLEDGRITFSAMKDRHQQIWSVRRDGSGRRQLTDLEGWSFNQHPLPGGTGLVFTHFSEAESTPHIWRVDLDGGDVRRLTGGEGEFLSALSADGRTLLFTRFDRRDEVWRMPSDGGEPEKILEDVSGLIESPDGRLIAYSVQEEVEGRIRDVWHVIPAGGGESISGFTPPGDAEDLEWVPDGSALTYLHIESGVQNIWKQPIEGGDPVQMTLFDEGRISNYEHSPDGSAIALVRIVGKDRNVWTVRADGSSPARLTDFRTGLIFDIEWERSGDGLVVNQGDLRREVVLITRSD